MIGKKEIKRDTQLIVLSVIILVIVSLNVSYSAFFSVQSLSTIQEISTGDLNVAVSVDNTNSILNEETEIFPSTIEEVTNEATGNYSVLTLLNEGTLDAEYSVTVNYDYDKLRTISGFEGKTDAELRSSLVSFDYLNIGIYDDVNGSWINFASNGSEVLYPAISSLVPTSADSYNYPILKDTITVSGTKRFKIYIWLSDSTPTSEIGKYVYLKLSVKCAAGDETITETVGS